MGRTCRMTSRGMAVSSVAWPWALRVCLRGEWESQVRLLDGLDSAADLTRITQHATWLWLALAVLALALTLGELWPEAQAGLLPGDTLCGNTS